jgi:sugar (pentulose or hexulose) kinase
MVGIESGRPLMARIPDGELNLANFMKMQIYSALGALRLGVDILEQESVKMDSVCGHGGFFKTEFIGASAMSVALKSPISVMKNAGEGGAWGIAILALYSATGKQSLDEFLEDLFAKTQKITTVADEDEKNKFERFMIRYKKCLGIEKESVKALC